MDLNTLLIEIEKYDYSKSMKPSQLSVILGYDSVNSNRTDSFSENTNIDIYKSFMEVAFLFEEFAINASEIFMLGILLGSIDNASNFLKKMKALDNGYEKLINYLYYKKHIVLVNRNTKANQLIELAREYDIKEVLIIGKEHVSKKALSLLKPDTLVGQVLHCSPRNLSIYPDEFFNVWFLHNDLFINNIESFKKTKFDSFNLLKNNFY